MCVSDDGATRTRLFIPFAEARDVGGIAMLDVPIERVAAERYRQARIKTPLPGQSGLVASGFDFDHHDLGAFADTWGINGIYELLLIIAPRTIWYRAGSDDWLYGIEIQAQQKNKEEGESVMRRLLPLLQKLDTQHLELLGREAVFPGVRTAATELFRGHLVSDAVKS